MANTAHQGTKLGGGWKYELKDTLDAIKTCGEVATKKQYSQFANPGLKIGDDLIALPLDLNQVTIIRDASRQAPFGRGDKTLVDTSVRNTWELDASKFQLANPAWSTFLNHVLQHVSQSLGMSGVKAELYKLLLYEEGSFFKPHKDSEKAPGMIATLSMCLPSSYKGGEVHLSHAKKDLIFDTGGQSPFDIFALAWYADVTHEIKSIVEGYRLVLIYNIIQTSGGATSADFFAKQDQNLQKVVAELHTRLPTPKRLLYFLDHKYSQTSLRMDHLKGRDRAVGRALQEACAGNGWYMLLCNVTKKSSDGDYGYYDDDDDDEDDGPGLVMDTVATCNGRVFVSDVKLDSKDILGPDPYHGRSADSTSVGEETGNEGASVQYRYHNSAAVIVPKDQLHQFFDVDTDMKVLVDFVVDDLKAHPEDSATRKSVTDFLRKALDEDPAVSSLVITEAWRMGDDSLFRAAVHAGCSRGVPEAGVIQELIKIVKSAPAGPIDWDKSFGVFVASHRSIAQLSKSLDVTKALLGPGDMQTSFQQWRPTIELLNFESRQSLALRDHDAIIELAALHWENVGWVRNRLVPKLRDCAEKKLLSKFIRSLLQKDREGTLQGARDIAAVLLESGTQKLSLARINFNSLLGTTPDREERDRFCHLLDDCLLSNLQPAVDELLRLGLDTIKNVPRKKEFRYFDFEDNSEDRTLAELMLYSMCEDFEKNKMPPSEPARDFVIAVLKKYVVTDLPNCPQPLRGHSHRPRGCGACKHCVELDAFLVSETEIEKEFYKGPKICSHLETNLPRDIFQTAIRHVELPDKKPQPILKVVKLNREYQVAMEEYKKELRQILAKLQPLRTGYMKGLLGDAAYGELLMLEHLPHIGDVELDEEKESRVGSKRGAQEDIELPLAKKRSFVV